MIYKIIGYIALAVIAAYIGLRIAGERAFKKVVESELNHVLHGKEHKVKGRYE